MQLFNSYLFFKTLHHRLLNWCSLLLPPQYLPPLWLTNFFTTQTSICPSYRQFLASSVSLDLAVFPQSKASDFHTLMLSGCSLATCSSPRTIFSLPPPLPLWWEKAISFYRYIQFIIFILKKHAPFLKHGNTPISSLFVPHFVTFPSVGFPHKF